MSYSKLILGVMSLSIFLLARNAAAYTPVRGNITATLGPYIFNTNWHDTPTGYKSPEQWGAALTALGDVNDSGSLEISVIYMNKLYALQESAKTIAEKTQLVHVTMGYRFWLWPYLSTSLGLYTSYPMGDVEVVYNDFASGTTPATSARSTTETGLDWAIQGQLWGQDRFALISEARYSYSLTKKSGEHADQYGFFLGIRYFVQGDLK